MDNANPKIIEVYRARNLPEAHTIRIALEEAGINAQIDGELLQGAVGDLPLGWATAPRILVEESHAASARHIIQRVDSREYTDLNEGEHKTSQCLECGLPMTEAESTCRSCGWSFQDNEAFTEPANDLTQDTSDSSFSAGKSRLRQFIILLIAVVALGVVLTIAGKKSVNANLQQGLESLKRKDFDGAIDSFSKVIRWDAKNATALVNRGQAYAGKGEYDLAIADYDRAIQLVPNYADAYSSRGSAHNSKHEFDLAIDNCNRALSFDSSSAQAYTVRGFAYTSRRAFDLAIRDFDMAIRIDPKYADAYLCRGYAYTDKREYDLAIADYDRAISLDPENVPALVNRGFACNSKGKYGLAVEDYDRAISIDPKYSDAYNQLAWLQAVCPEAGFRDGKKAVENAKKACDLSDWKDVGFFDTLAAAYAEAGEFDEAVKWQKKALDSPDFAKKDTDREKEIEKARLRLGLYQERKPYREN